MARIAAVVWWEEFVEKTIHSVLIDGALYNVSGVDAVVNKNITASKKQLDLDEARPGGDAPGRRTWNLDVVIAYNLGSCFTRIVQSAVVCTRGNWWLEGQSVAST